MEELKEKRKREGIIIAKQYDRHESYLDFKASTHSTLAALRTWDQLSGGDRIKHTDDGW
eukprot:SAG11_NODE_20180_length_451_cov_0.676136_1_plen_58_part_10